MRARLLQRGAYGVAVARRAALAGDRVEDEDGADAGL
jgi:hypothetical protein